MTVTILVLARTLHIGSAMLLVALPFFTSVILRPFFAADSVERSDAFCRSVIKLLWLALVVELVSGFVWFWFVSAEMNDQSPWSIPAPTDLSTVLWQTQFGQLWLGRAVIGALLSGLLYFMPHPIIKNSRGFGVALIIGAVLLISLAWAGHAAAGIHYRVLHLFADALHLLLGAVWPLGLIPLSLFLHHIHRQTEVGLADPGIAVLNRFSQASLIAVLILLVTGFINGWLIVGSWLALVTTTYGWLLLAKVLLVGIMIALGAYNRLRLLPRLVTSPVLFLALQRTVFAESILALLVLLIVGVMGMTSPPS